MFYRKRHSIKLGDLIHCKVWPCCRLAVFESLDISSLQRLRPRPLRVTRFMVDVNLGKLAKRLRMFGFDTAYRNDLEDDEIVENVGWMGYRLNPDFVTVVVSDAKQASNP